jgi:hypothetical protein
VGRVEPGQDAGPVQKIMNQRVDGDHPAADLDPEAHVHGGVEQEGGQGHGEDLADFLHVGVGDACVGFERQQVDERRLRAFDL